MCDFICVCKMCQRLLKKKDRSAAYFWVDLCKYHNNCMIHLNGKDFKELRILERLKYIVTTEKEDYISVKLLGFFEQDNGEYFCINRAEHTKNED